MRDIFSGLAAVVVSDIEVRGVDMEGFETIYQIVQGGGDPFRTCSVLSSQSGQDQMPKAKSGSGECFEKSYLHYPNWCVCNMLMDIGGQLNGYRWAVAF